MERRLSKRVAWWLAALVFALVLGGRAEAAPLGLTPGLPDIAASQIALSYDAATGFFTATSDAPLFYNPGSLPILLSSYTLTATIDNDGSLVSPGTVSLSGLLEGITPLSLTASLTAFGFNASGTGILEFLGVVTSDTNAGFGVGSAFGIIMNSQVADLEFRQSFFHDSTSGVSADNFHPISEPATLTLLGLGLLGLRFVRRRRRS
jgi:hypothetical protein